MLRWTVLILGCLSLSTTVAMGQTRPPERTRGESRIGRTPGDVNHYNPRQVLRKPIRPIISPPVVSADKAEILPNELVLGVEINGAARAYSINQLTGPQREIINDVLGGTAIAATW